MNTDRLTQNAQAALGPDQGRAPGPRHGGRGPLAGDPAVRLFAKLDVPPEALAAELDKGLKRRPRISRHERGAGTFTVSQRLSRLMAEAKQEAIRLGEEYVGVEHILMAVLEEGKVHPSGCLLSEASRGNGCWMPR